MLFRSGEAISSWLFDLLRRARIISLVSEQLGPLAESIDRFLSKILGRVRKRPEEEAITRGDRLTHWGLALLVGVLLSALLHFILATVGPLEVLRALWMGVHTLGRVCLLLILATLVWTPIGVAIGFRPQLAQKLQPLVLFLASFPANFIFPFATVFFLREIGRAHV